MLKTLLLFIVFMSARASLAADTPITIIHINDLHSQFDSFQANPFESKRYYGGYLRVQSLIAQLKKKAQDKQRPVIVLDAGDWGEGSSFYFPTKGAKSVQLLGALGVDVSMIGNHDYMFGSDAFFKQLSYAPAGLRFVLANVDYHQHIDAHIKKYKVPLTTHVSWNLPGGKRVGIVGLTTSAWHFRKYIRPSKILPAMRTYKKWERKYAERFDAVIALTHLDHSKDKRLARTSRKLSMIVGGHDHIRTVAPHHILSRGGRSVPIVQAGAHGLYVGEFEGVLKDDGQIQTQMYRIHPVFSQGPVTELEAQQSPLARGVLAAHKERHEWFKDYRLGDWDEVIGASTLQLDGYVKGQLHPRSSCWGQHLAEMVRQNTKADMALNFNFFHGQAFAPGPITVGMMVENYPHTLRFENPGWHMVRLSMPRALVKSLLTIADKRRTELGMTYSMSQEMLSERALNLGRLVRKESYTVAMTSEGAEYFARAMPQFSNLILRGLKHFDRPMWPAMIDYVKLNTPLTPLVGQHACD